MIVFEELDVHTPKREVLLDITEEIAKVIRDSNVKEGVCRIFVPHTTAGITINENADPAVKRDIIDFLKELIPQRYNFSHGEGNSDAHIKSSLIGSSITVILHGNRMLLGTWQGLYFAEFDGPRNRKVYVQVQGE